MDQLAGLTEDARKLALDRFRLIQPYLEQNQSLQSGERQEAGGQYTKCMIPKGRDPLTSAFARSKH